MPTPVLSGSALPVRSALKAEDDGEKSASPKAVQIAEPLPAHQEDHQHKKHFTASVGRRLSGRPPLSTNSSRASPVSNGSLESLGGVVSNPPSASASEDASAAAHSQAKPHRVHRASERLLAQVGEWLEREKAKRARRQTKRTVSRRRHLKSEHISEQGGTLEIQHHRSPSMDSDSSEVSLDRLARILDDNMAALGLGSLPRFSPRLGRRHSRKGHISLQLARPAASSDTEYVDGDVLVPSCDAVLDNTKATSNAPGGKADLAHPTPSSGTKQLKEKQARTSFKSEIVRIAHTLKLKGWRRVPLDQAESINVERLSGALTNAVYVVSPPEPMNSVSDGKKPPAKLLLRVYGPQVDIDRDNELQVLQRLARKKIGPRLLGTFVNGRFEQYFNATTLTLANMREPETSKHIAKRMRELHDGIELLEEERAEGPLVWKNWDRWVDQVEKKVVALDKCLLNGTQGPVRGPADAWKQRGLVCGVQWHIFKNMVDRYRQYLDDFYGGQDKIRERLVFAHNDTQYGNILRLRPDSDKSPLLEPANEHKQLIVIDFEYAGANVPGLEFANHFSEWTYNYHDEIAPYSCKTAMYPTPEQQYRFIKAYVDHQPEYQHPSATPKTTPLSTPLLGGSQVLRRAGSTSSIAEFMLDARAPPGGWTEEDSHREERSDRRVRELMEETRLWRIANSAQWVAWGIMQAKVPDLDRLMSGNETGGGDNPVTSLGEELETAGADNASDEFDYLGYAQERAYFFWGDCVLAGLVNMEDLPETLRDRVKLVHY
ncbi:hypothetical protein VTK73DRAFT_5363 [Phialemonium thermophilum]|uniref:Choline kinase N-terminal domain-containing protein n=1 Tax=Phialemonium thermophilum TaxID=223376 RepID=A0ABR3Y8P6_9PEZI